MICVSPRANGGLLKQHKVKYQYTCGQAHPGLCATVDADILPLCKMAADELRKYLEKFETGTFYRLCVVSQGYEGEGFFESAYLRGASPKIAVLGDSSLDRQVGAVDCLSKDRLEDGYVYEIAATLLGKYFRASPNGIDKLYVAGPVFAAADAQ